MTRMWRLFIAIELPSNILSVLAEIQNKLKLHAPPHTIRWVKPQNIHLTFKFLGDVSAAKRDTLQSTLTQAVQEHSRFTLVTGNLGCFPNLKRPRVVWISIHPPHEPLVALHNAIEHQLAPLGYPTESRSFKPHLTLGRIHRNAKRNDVQTVANLLAHTPTNASVPWHVTSVSLIRSELRPEGAKYTQLFHATLGFSDTQNKGTDGT